MNQEIEDLEPGFVDQSLFINHNEKYFNVSSSEIREAKKLLKKKDNYLLCLGLYLFKKFLFVFY